MFQERAACGREASLGNLGGGVHCLLPVGQGLSWQSPEEFAGKADELLCQEVVTQLSSSSSQSTPLLRLRAVTW